jgi:hypothetical protein
MWLQDFLPKDLPNVRIMSFGYDSRIEANRETSRMLDYGRSFIQQLHNARSSKGVCYKLELLEPLSNTRFIDRVTTYHLHRTLARWYPDPPGIPLIFITKW